MMTRSEDEENVVVDDIPDENQIVLPIDKVKAEIVLPLEPKDKVKVEIGVPFESPLPPSQGSSAYTESDESEIGDDDNKVTCRKEKSLGLLCQRFISAMKEATSPENNSVHLESIAQKMKVEKRRIYDIVNVMEALDAMSKLNKSYYAWHGLGNLPKLMQELQRESIEENLPSRILQVEQAMCSFTDLSPGARRKDLVGSLIDQGVVLPSSTPSPMLSSPVESPFSSKCSRILTPTPSMTSSPSTSQFKDSRNGKNSLAMLCRRFIMVLLANPQDRRRVSLDVASTVLIKDTETEGFEPPSRGRCRRLYDIANVLVAMGIIKKVHYLFGTKKIPLFIYSGPEPDEHNILTDEKLEEMMALPRKAMDDVIREKTFGKRSKSEACMDDVMKQQRAGKMSRIGSPHDSPNTAANKMMELANAAERERLMMRMSFVMPPSPNARKRMTQSTSNIHSTGMQPSSSWSPATHSIPTSPLAMGAGQFVLPRTQPWTLYRTYSDLSTAGTTTMVRSPRSLLPHQSPLSGMAYRLVPANSRASTSTGAPTVDNTLESPKSARRVLAPLQPSIGSPLNSGRKPSPKKTPKYSIKNILKASPFKSNSTNIAKNTQRVSIGGLNHRGSSLFKVVKKEENVVERRVLGHSNVMNVTSPQTTSAALAQLRHNLGL